MFKRVTIYLWLAFLLMGATIVHANPALDIAPNDAKTGEPFTGMAGDRGPNALSIPVSLTNDAEVGPLSAVGFIIKYDPALLEFSAVDSLDGNKSATTNLAAPDRKPGELKIGFLGINNSAILNGADGPILNLRFNILSTAAIGDTTVELLEGSSGTTPDAVPIPLDNGNNTAAVTINAANPAGSLTLGANPANGGTAASDPVYDPKIPYNIGNLVNITATPAAGYNFANWSCTGIQTDLAATKASNSLTLADDTDVTCTANFSLITYNLTLNTNPANKGTFSSDPLPADPASGARYGINKFVPNTSVKVTFAPSDGYTFDGWTGSNCVTGTATAMDNPLTVAMTGAKTCTAKVVLTPIDGKCGASAGGTFPTAPTEGLCDVGTASAVAEANNQWAWTCAGPNSGAVASCNAAIRTYTLTFNSAGNGSIDGTTPQTIRHNGSANAVTAVPTKGYHFVNWTGTNGFVTTAANPLTLANVTADQTITANFSIDSVDGQCGTSAGGNFRTTPVENLCSAGTSGEPAQMGNLWTWTCAGTDGGSDTPCTANVQIDAACGGNAGGDFMSAPTDNLCADGSLPTVAKNGNNQWAWTCPGINGGNDASCDANLQIDAVCGASAGGTFPTAPTADLCAVGTASAVAETDNQWAWSCAGVSSGADASCNAAIRTYALTFNSAGNGSIDGTTPQTIRHNGSANAVTAVPAEGYHFVNWTGTNGFVTTAANPLTLANVTADQAITANFSIDPTNAACGGSAGGNFATVPATDLCATGSASDVAMADGLWTWTCAGTDGGSDATCTANVRIDAACGSANGQVLTAAPTADLCATGTPSAVTGSGPWTWTCAGTNGGSDDSCTANVQDTNTPPVALDQAVSTALNTAVAITLEGTDADNDPLTYELLGVPGHGALAGSGNHLTYTPAANYFGADSFSFKVNDGQVDSNNVALVSITVTAVNDKPALVVSTLEDGSTTNVQLLNITGGVTDADGVASLTINGAAIVLEDDGSFSHAHTLAIGANQIDIVATDILGNTTTDSRAIIFDPNGPQLTVSEPADNSKTKETVIDVKGAVSDEEATVTIVVNGGAPTSVYQGQGNFSTSVTLVPDTLNTIEITATDDLGNSTTVKRSVTNDLTGPDLAITDPVADTETTASAYILKGTVSEDAVGVVITLDGKTYTPAIVNGAFEQSLPLPTAKTYQVTVTATDDVGNATELTRNIVKQAVWTDISAKVGVTKAYPVYDRINKVYYVVVKVTNPAGNGPLAGALRMVVTNPSPALKTALAGLKPNGTTVNGEQYFNLLAEGGSLAAGGSIGNLRLNFEVKLPITFGVRIEQLK